MEAGAELLADLAGGATNVVEATSVMATSSGAVAATGSLVGRAGLSIYRTWSTAFQIRNAIVRL